jgi:hypothetical protein
LREQNGANENTVWLEVHARKVLEQVRHEYHEYTIEQSDNEEYRQFLHSHASESPGNDQDEPRDHSPREKGNKVQAQKRKTRWVEVPHRDNKTPIIPWKVEGAFTRFAMSLQENRKMDGVEEMGRTSTVGADVASPSIESTTHRPVSNLDSDGAQIAGTESGARESSVELPFMPGPGKAQTSITRLITPGPSSNAAAGGSREASVELPNLPKGAKNRKRKDDVLPTPEPSSDRMDEE